MRGPLIAALIALALPAAAQDAAGLLVVMADEGGDPLDVGLVAYYKLDGNAYDEVTQATGTWGAAVTTVAGIDGSAAGLDKSATAFVTTVGGTNLLNGADGFTMTAWVNQQLGWVSFCGYVISYGGSGTGMGMQGGDTPRELAANTPNVTLTDSGAGEFPFMEWHHVAATIENGSPFLLYVDGVLVHTGSSTLTGGIEQHGPMQIGYDEASTVRKFGGWMDEVKIWERALSSNEVNQVYQEFAP